MTVLPANGLAKRRNRNSSGEETKLTLKSEAPLYRFLREQIQGGFVISASFCQLSCEVSAAGRRGHAQHEHGAPPHPAGPAPAYAPPGPCRAAPNSATNHRPHRRHTRMPRAHPPHTQKRQRVIQQKQQRLTEAVHLPKERILRKLHHASQYTHRNPSPELPRTTRNSRESSPSSTRADPTTPEYGPAQTPHPDNSNAQSQYAEPTHTSPHRHTPQPKKY